MFHVGQRVVCTNASNWPTPVQFGGYVPILPVLGRIYTIRAIVPTTRNGHDEEACALSRS